MSPRRLPQQLARLTKVCVFLGASLALAIGGFVSMPALAAMQDGPSQQAGSLELAEPFPGTERLETEDDLASRMIDGIDSFLLDQWEQTIEARHQAWEAIDARDREEWMTAKRMKLREILGLRDEIPSDPAARYWSAIDQPEPLARSTDGRFEARYVTWTGFDSVTFEGLLLEPVDRSQIRGNVIVVPDADQTIESLALGLGQPTDAAEPHFAKRLAESGVRVLVMASIDRTLEKFNDRALQTRREYIYRPAFELGRGLIGYEVSGVLAARRWMSRQGERVCVAGWGEGGYTALLAAALDPEFAAVGVSAYFEPHGRRWHEPLDRNLFGYAKHFGDAELAALVWPRAVLIEAARGPEVTLPSFGGAPAELRSPELSAVEAEYKQLQAIVSDWSDGVPPTLFQSGGDGQGLPGSTDWTTALLQVCLPDSTMLAEPLEWAVTPNVLDNEVRQKRLIAGFDAHTQRELSLCADVRRQFMADVDTSSLEAYEKSIEAKREYFRQTVIGDFGIERVAPAVRSRRAYSGNGWTGYDVEMDVFDSVVATGILLWPEGIQPGEKRPVVVCQHGLEGRPTDIIQGDHPAYHDFAAKLAERGFIVYAPQNIYLFTDRFRTLQRKANPLGCTLFSIMTPQHEQLTDWLAGLESVDPDRIAFYGLSYGGKSAMRLPALVDRYCLSICSADFNEWVWKNASTSSNYSYVWTGEYEIFEYNLGNTFNYAEMAALICPRPFMVERGHFDGVAPDETVAYEFAKVRHLYQAKLGIGDRCELEWFVGPHTINGQGTYRFLHRHLQWPEPK